MSLNRREFIYSSGGWILQIRSAKDVLIVRSESPTDYETPLHLLDNSWITPNDLHYVRTHLPTPDINLSTWNLVIDGEVNAPLKLTLGDIHGFRETTRTVTLECSGNGRV